MSWLFVRRLRGFVLLAALASLFLNVALLMPSIYMMQVFDRVFSSRSVETLVMLGAITLTFLALGYFLDTVRVRTWRGPVARSTGSSRPPRFARHWNRPQRIPDASTPTHSATSPSFAPS